MVDNINIKHLKCCVDCQHIFNIIYNEILRKYYKYSKHDICILGIYTFTQNPQLNVICRHQSSGRSRIYMNTNTGTEHTKR